MNNFSFATIEKVHKNFFILAWSSTPTFGSFLNKEIEKVVMSDMCHYKTYREAVQNLKKRYPNCTKHPGPISLHGRRCFQLGKRKCLT